MLEPPSFQTQKDILWFILINNTLRYITLPWSGIENFITFITVFQKYYEVRHKNISKTLISI